MKYSNKCECCGHKSNAFTHKLNSGIIDAFIVFVQRFYETGQPVNINTDINLTHNQLANFRKLKFFSLIMKTSKSGYWVPTDMGVSFYHGAMAVPDTVATMNNKVLPGDHE